MGDVVNLRMARKSRKRAEKDRIAAENRAAHGLGKGGKRRIEQERENAGRHLENHRLTDPPSRE